MAVKIDDVAALSATASILNNFASQIFDATNNANSKFSAKIEGSYADALNKYIDIMNNMTTQIFQKFPEDVQQFASALQEYEAGIQGEGFGNIIRSSKPGVEEAYCTNLRSTHASVVMHGVDTVKKAINQVISDSEIAILAGVTSDSVTNVTEHWESFSGKLDRHITKIKKTRSNLEQKNKALISKLITIERSLSEATVAIEMAVSVTDISPKSFIIGIKNGFFTVDNMDACIEMAGSKENAQALKYLAEEDFEAFFEMNPENVTDEVYDVLSGYMVALIPEFGEPAIEDTLLLSEIMNAMLSKSVINYNLSGKEHGIKLSASISLMGLQTGLLAIENDNEELKKLHEKFTTLDMLMVGINALSFESAKNDGNVTSIPSYNILNLVFTDEGKITFDILEKTQHYEHGEYHADNTIYDEWTTSKVHIGNTISSGGIVSDYLNTLEGNIKEFIEQRDEALVNAVQNSVTGAIGIYNPALGVAAEILVNLSNSEWTDVGKNSLSQLSELIASDSGKNTSNGIISIAKEWIDAIIGSGKTNGQITAETQKLIDALTGVGGTQINQSGSGTVIVPGTPSISSLQAKQELEEYGVTKYLDREYWAKYEGNLNMNPEVTDEVRDLLLGKGGSLDEIDAVALNQGLLELAGIPNANVDVDGLYAYLAKKFGFKES